MLVASVIAARPVSAQATIWLYAGVATGSESWFLPEQSITTLIPGVSGVAIEMTARWQAILNDPT